MCRKHNDANVMSLGGRSTGSLHFYTINSKCADVFITDCTAGPEVAKQMVDVYLSTRWEGETNERHANRVVGFGFVILCCDVTVISSCGDASGMMSVVVLCYMQMFLKL